MRSLGTVLLMVVCTAGVTRAEPARYASDASMAAVQKPLDAFETDSISRQIPSRGRFTCPEVDLTMYRGTTLPLHKPVRMHRAFVARVSAFEVLVREVAVRVYGREPRRMRHIGSYVCRRMKTHPTLLSEHALGLALDVEGFEFAAGNKSERAAAPKGLGGSFTVTMSKHWSATKGTGAVHARFLRELADALIAREDLFRVMLGASYPGHQDHLHLDMSTYRMIEL